jgi:ribosomal-protein-alanine N-acetyltransferase
MKNPYEVGNTIYLRAPEVEDVGGSWYQWFSDYDTTKYLIDRFLPNTKTKQLNYFDSINNDHSIILAIVDKNTDEHIGICSLSGINWFHRFSDVAIVIGSKDPQYRIVSVEAMRLLLRVAFIRLKLINLRAACAATNIPIATLLNLYKFRRVGVYQNLCYVDGKYTDLHLLQLKRSDWLERNKLILDN